MGKTILVTGATKGLGRALSYYFAKEGAVVHGCGRDLQGLRLLAADLPEPSQFCEVNVADDGQVEQWSKRVIAEVGAPDLVINNAAMINRNARLWELSADEICEGWNVNVLGVTHVIRHFVPAMLKRGTGVVVNFSSGWGRSTSAEVASYCASKWAIEGLTQAFAQDLTESGKSVVAVAVNPGIIDTQMLRSCFGSAASHYPNPEEWVRRAGPFLLSLNARHHGRSLDIPGESATWRSE